MPASVMSPSVMRLIFGGFALLMAGVSINTLLLQPDVTPVLAKALPTTSIARSAPATVAILPAAIAPARIATAAVAPPAKETAKETIRIAGLSTDSAQPARMPRLPELEGDPDVILRVQKDLLSRGYGPVVPNGIIGPLSRAAIMAFEHDNALPITGEATDFLLRRMREGADQNRQASADARKIRSPEAEQVVRTVQHSLTTLGFEPGRIDGRVGDDTERAIRTFETANGMTATGRVSAELFSLLARAMGARSAKVMP